MFQNYFRTAWRSLLRNKVYSFLNITGLTLGMSVALLIGLWVYDQYSFDRWLPANRQACQVRFNALENGSIRTESAVDKQVVNPDLNRVFNLQIRLRMERKVLSEVFTPFFGNS